MVSEHDVRSRLAKTEEQLQFLISHIGPLQDLVGSGANGWLQALQNLADCYK